MTNLKLRADGAGNRPVVIPMGALSTSSSSTGKVIPDSAESPPWRVVELQAAMAPSAPRVRIIANSHFQWIRYLTEMKSAGKLSTSVTAAARELWEFLLERAPGITVPHAGPTSEGGLQMAWDRDRHYFELEVSPSARYDWFYRDHEENRYWGEEDCTVGSYSSELISTVRLVWPSIESRKTGLAMVGGERR